MPIKRDSRYITARVYGIQKTPTDHRTLLDGSRVVVEATRSFTHRIEEGDTLENLAATLLGDATKWWVIADVNGIFDPLTLEVGTLLDIPTRV